MEDSNKLIERGFELHKKGKVKEALELYSEALSSQNSNPKLLFLVGLANLQTSNFVSAINFFQKTISLDPNNYGAYNNLGAAYLPEWNFNGIGNLSPGQGYQIKLNQSAELVYFSIFESY